MNKKLLGSYYPKCNSNQKNFKKHEDISGQIIIEDEKLKFKGKFMIIFNLKSNDFEIPLKDIVKAERINLNSLMPFGVLVTTYNGDEFMFGHMNNKKLEKMINDSLTEIKKKREKSFGCIITLDDKVLLVEHKEGHWGFPKGHIEKNETEEECAIREVKEETNLDVKLVSKKKYQISYAPKIGTIKDVVFFEATPLTKTLKKQDKEINNIKWFSYNECLKTITFENEKNVFKDFLKEKDKNN